MKNKNITRILLGMIFIIVLTATIVGCGKNDDNIASKDFIYRYEELPASKEFPQGASLGYTGDFAFLFGTVWDEFYMNSELVIAWLTEDGNVERKLNFKIPPSTYYGNVVGSTDGRLFAIKTKYPIYDDYGYDGENIRPLDLDVLDTDDLHDTDDELDTGDVLDYQSDAIIDPDAINSDDVLDYVADDDAVLDDVDGPVATPVSSAVSEIAAATSIVERAVPEIAVADTADNWGDYAYQTEQYYLVELGMDGTEKEIVLLNDNKDLNDMDYFYIDQLFSMPGNKLVVSAMQKYALYEANGSYLELYDIDIGDSGWGINFLTLRGDRSILHHMDDQKIVFYDFDVMTGKLNNEYIIEGNIYSYYVHPGAGYDIYLTDNNDLYGYNLGQEMVKLMNYVDSDLNTYNINNLLAIEEGRFWCMIYDSSEGRNYFAQFTKVPPEEVVDRIGLVLAGSYVDWDIKNRVVNFNKHNDKYRISIIDYGSLYNTNDDWRAGLTRLNTDIATGRAPDILAVTNDLPIGSYMAKGLFADLLPFIAKDDELDVNDLMPNVVEAYSMDGKMYRLVPQFGIGTVIAKSSLVGSEPGWSVADAKALSARFPDAALFDMMTISSLMYYAMIYSGDQFINWEKGECYFTGEGFIHLLEFMKDFPEEIDYTDYERMDYYWDNYESNYRANRILLNLATLGNLREYNRIAKGTFGEDVTMIGFPAENGNGAALVTYQSFAMSARSKNRDGAWEFLRYYLTEEYQTEQVWMLPLSRKAFDIKAKEAMEKPYWIDENGEKIEYDDEWYIEGNSIPIEPMTQSEVDQLINYILTVNNAGEYNEDLVNIITEEAGSFFAGQKTVHEVVDIIQSRAQIYVNENK